MLKKYGFWILAVILGLVYFVPLPTYIYHILILTLFYAFLGTTWNLMCGFGGQLSLGYSAFTGIGAYVTLLLYLNFKLSPWAGMLVAAAVSCIVMFITAYPCFRFGLRGPFFTLASIAVAEILRDVLKAARDVTGGSLGLTLPYHTPSLALFQFDGKNIYYLIITCFFLGALFIVQKMERLRYYLIAIREDEDAAAASGVSVNKTLLLAAGISSVLVSLGGTFYIQYFRFIDPDTIVGMPLSITIALICIVGGAARVYGPAVGALILVPLSEYLRLSLGGTSFFSANLIIYGALLVLTIIFMPEGIVGFFQKKAYFSRGNKQKIAAERGMAGE